MNSVNNKGKILTVAYWKEITNEIPRLGRPAGQGLCADHSPAVPRPVRAQRAQSTKTQSQDWEDTDYRVKQTKTKEL